MIDIKVLINESSKLSLREQCKLLALPRSSYYYTPKGESEENLKIMVTMDKYILKEPTAGVLTMQSMLKDMGIFASYEHVRQLMRKTDRVLSIPPQTFNCTWKKEIYLLNGFGIQ